MAEKRTLITFDGTELFSKKNTAEQPKAAAVIVHGLAEHMDRYEALTEKLVEHGITVYRYDQRGHARSGGRRVYFSDFNEMPDDAKTMVDTAKAEHPELPVFLIGHSMGGFTAAAFGTKYPGSVKGIVLSGALTRYNKEIFGPLPIDKPDDFYFDNELGDGVCSDPEVVKAYENDPLVEKKISAGLLNAFPPGIEWLTRQASDFTDPVFVLHGNEDGLIAEKDSRDFYSDISSRDKTLKIYAFLMHEIFNEPVKYAIYNEVIDWIHDRV
ncbi:alpha/beta hydrolase [Sinobaca sp. H24]|uniref:alpha/beta hydrolase n=1 Tax=Sinobaca sp. H24 TaxID=2923376 RepID=UPI0020792296|nr:alpha/beta hydrolase [Sinobaca sp. H24]